MVPVCEVSFMSVFEEIKERVSTKEAAMYYGLTVDRKGMCCCPFHNYIVSTKKGNPLNTGHFNYHLKAITSTVGVPYMSSHKIRFWSITELARATGGDLETDYRTFYRKRPLADHFFEI